MILIFSNAKDCFHNGDMKIIMNYDINYEALGKRML